MPHGATASPVLHGATAPTGATAEADAFLARLDAARPGIFLGLAPSLALLARVGNPQETLRVVHVAGTNGKGSICAMVAAALRSAGVRVGTFSSPHLLHASDAVTIDGSPDPLGWAASVEAIRDAAGGAEVAAGTVTAFEATTAAMWLQLATAKVDVAVVEVGVGGRLDATNVCSSSLVSVVGAIALDHTDLLGATLGLIAREKGGVFKKGCPAVLPADIVPEVEDSLLAVAREVGASPIVRAPPAQLLPQVPGQDGGGRRVRCGGLDMELRLNGAFQLENAGIAVAALQAIQATGVISLSDENIAAGVAGACWPGRLEWVQWRGKEVLVDGAHNEAAAKALRAFIDALGVGRVRWVVGMVSGKDIHALLRALLRPSDTLYPVEISRASLPARLSTLPVTQIRAAADALGFGAALRDAGEPGLSPALHAALSSNGSSGSPPGEATPMAPTTTLCKAHNRAGQLEGAAVALQDEGEEGGGV